MAAYIAKYPVGSYVRIPEREFLEDFKRTWKYHHPLESGQLKRAGLKAKVRSVGFYHGGDALYELKRIPGIWHEVCLRPVGTAGTGLLEWLRRLIWP